MTTETRATTCHPLDPLTADEIALAARVIRTERPLGGARFVSIDLREPPKDTLAGAAAPLEREAFAVLLDVADGRTYEAVVSLDAGAVRSWRHVPGVQPAITFDEFFTCERVVKADPAFQEALRRRGITDPDLVMVDPWSAGYYGDASERGRRLLRALAWVRASPEDNGYAHPIENVVVVVDLLAERVVRVEDDGVVPVPWTPGQYAADAVGPPREGVRPIEIRQPEGTSFTVHGREVRWQKWRLRLGYTSREGLVLHTVGYEDGGRVRSILHRASLAEMVVPYGDPAPGHWRKNAFDAGEYSIGTLANALELGCDCLGVIHYFDAVVANAQGEPVTIPNAVCLHEEDYGMLWKHTDFRTGRAEVRRSRRLVVSFIATVGNYEYGFFWYFYQDGTIEFEVKMTGIVSTGALAPGQSTPYGQRLNADGLYAPIHQHFFNLRLDLDVDGPVNSVYEVHTEAVPPGPDNPHGNAFASRATPLRTELEAQQLVDPLAGRYWAVVNPAVRNAVGDPVGYRLMPRGNVRSFAQPDASITARAAFITKHLWVTPYHPDERHPAGEYPNQHPGGAGLPAWTKANRSIEQTDVVLWYTLGSHHPVRLEDWPVMPAQYTGFMLQPNGFFDRNPALDVPPSHDHASHGAGHDGHGGHDGRNGRVE
ncbi:MAG TPA: primary-amine oxidase [Thermomicrobiaceae bacterium]|nr:primary-amine oxidase [Thermomicrobiaceae bacterium]